MQDLYCCVLASMPRKLQGFPKFWSNPGHMGFCCKSFYEPVANILRALPHVGWIFLLLRDCSTGPSKTWVPCLMAFPKRLIEAHVKPAHTLGPKGEQRVRAHTMDPHEILPLPSTATVECPAKNARKPWALTSSSVCLVNFN